MTALGRISFEIFQLISADCSVYDLANLRRVNRASSCNPHLIRIIAHFIPHYKLGPHDDSIRVYGQYITPERILYIWGTLTLRIYLKYYPHHVKAEHWNTISMHKELDKEFIEQYGAFLDWDILAQRHTYVGDKSIIKYFHLLKTKYLLKLRYEGKVLRVLFDRINWREFLQGLGIRGG